MRTRKLLRRAVKYGAIGVAAFSFGIALHFAIDRSFPKPAISLPQNSGENMQASLVRSSAALPAPALTSTPVPAAPHSPLWLSSETPEQGDALAIRVNAATSTVARGTFFGKGLNFFNFGSSSVTFVGIPATKKPGTYPLSVSISKNEMLTRDITVKARKFPMTELKTTPELRAEGHTPAAINANVAAENNVLAAAFISQAAPHFTGSFVYPLGRITVVGAFGNVRVSGGVSIRHMGVDLEAAGGTPVYAMNDGVVRLVRSFADYGNTILIDHGAHVFSLYLHLSVFKVKVGDTVRRGETIALSGNTGYTLAPHLHFSVNVGGVSVDGLRFIETANAALGKN